MTEVFWNGKIIFMKEILKKFKKKLADGVPVYGPFMKTSDPAFVEATGYAGFDFVILDMEHGPNSLQSMQNLVRGALIAGVLPIFRVRDRQAESISQALDIGALGIQVPQVSTAVEVKEIIEAAKFSPDGHRGVCRFVRAAEYSATPASAYFREANEALVIIQIEGKVALENIDEIFSQKGVDIYFIGPYDLSQAIGVPGEIGHPEVLRIIRELINKAKEKKCTIGLFTDTIESGIEWKNLGVGYISYSVDVGIYYSACRNILDKLKKG